MTASVETLLVALARRIEENTAEFRALRAELSAFRAELAGDPNRPEYAVLLRAISAAFPKTWVSGADLVKATRSNTSIAENLRISILNAARAINARRLGKVFELIEGFDQEGLEILRGEKENDGVVWMVVPSVTMKVTVKATHSHQLVAPGHGRTP